MKYLKVIGTNIAVLLALLLGINILLISVWEVRRFVNYVRSDLLAEKRENLDLRALLPNYEGVIWARDFFEEFATLKDNNYRDYIGWKQSPYSGKTVQIDEKGNRHTVQYPLLSGEAGKIVMLGGSTMWGTGVNDSNTISSLLAAQTSGAFEVLNFGESGYRAFQSYIYLHLNYNEGLEADWVISYDGVNEGVGYISDIDPAATYASERIRARLKEKQQMSDLVTQLTYRHFFLGPIEKSIARFKAKKETAPERTLDMSDARGDAVARALLDGWLATYELANKNGARFLAVLQPNVAIGNPRTDHLNLPPYEQLLSRSYPDLYPRVQHILATDSKYVTLRDHFLDLSHSFDGDDYIFIDWCHVSPKGNQIIADQIWAELVKRMNNE